MKDKIVVKNANGVNINISVLGYFRIPDLNKEYVMYSMVDENPDNEYGAVLLGEVIKEDNVPVKILGIEENEQEMVMAYYNEVSSQLGDE